MKKIISIVASVLIILVLISMSNPREIWDTIKDTDLSIFAWTIPLTFVSLYLKALRWSRLLSDLGYHIKAHSLMPVYFKGITIASLTPGRAGEAIRPYLLKKEYPISFKKTLPTIVIERGLDMAVISCFAFVGAFFFPFGPGGKLAALATTTILFVATTALIGVFFSRRVTRLLFKIANKFPFGKKIAEHADSIISSIYESRKSISVKTLTLSFFYTVLSWICEVGVLTLTLLALGKSMSMLHILFIDSFAIVIGIASMLPGGIGSSEVSMAYFISRVSGTLSFGTSVSLLFRSVTLYLVFVSTAVLTLLEGKKKKIVKEDVLKV